MNQKRTVSDTVPFSEKMGYSHEREADANEKIRKMSALFLTLQFTTKQTIALAGNGPF